MEKLQAILNKFKSITSEKFLIQGDKIVKTVANYDSIIVSRLEIIDYLSEKY